MMLFKASAKVDDSVESCKENAGNKLRGKGGQDDFCLGLPGVCTALGTFFLGWWHWWARVCGVIDRMGSLGKVRWWDDYEQKCAFALGSQALAARLALAWLGACWFSAWDRWVDPARCG